MSWHTVKSAAVYVRTSERTIRNAIDSGELESSRIGVRDIRIKESKLDAWLEGRPHEPRSMS